MIILEKQLPTPVRLLIHQEIRSKEIKAVESVPGRVIYLTILQCHICVLNLDLTDGKILKERI